jgi:hypothetical protein
MLTLRSRRLFAATVWAQSQRNDRSLTLAVTIPVGGFYA